MLALTVPALAVVHRLQVTAVGIALLGVKSRCIVLLRQWVSRELNLIVGNHTTLQLCFDLRLQPEGDRLPAVERVHRDLVLKITTDNSVQDA